MHIFLNSAISVNQSELGFKVEFKTDFMNEI